MALWLTAVLALACLGGLAAPGPVPRPPAPSNVPLRELIEELINITQDQRAPLCNGSMVWSVDLRAGGFCAALDSLTNISSCKPIYKTQRILNGLCTRKASVGASNLPDTKIELAQFIKKLLEYSRQRFRYNQP